MFRKQKEKKLKSKINLLDIIKMTFQNKEQSVIINELNHREQNGHENKDDEKDEQKDNEEQPVYCVCRKPYEDEDMIGCDDCNEYYHIECIGMSQQEFQYFVDRDDEYFCKSCLEDAN